jgi:hypothetical protein
MFVAHPPAPPQAHRVLPSCLAPGRSLAKVQDGLAALREDVNRGFEDVNRGFEAVGRRFDGVEADKSARSSSNSGEKAGKAPSIRESNSGFTSRWRRRLSRQPRR